jgi:pyruvate,orthophosphate dikinase
MASRRHAVLSANGGAPVTRSASVRGGKGAGLALLTDLGLPVPPSFTLGTGVCRAYLQHQEYPNRVINQIMREIAGLEKLTGRTFGDPGYPLLVSVRSGAEESMPGMMDTILNVGLDPLNLEGLIRWGGKRFARDTRARFEEQWQTIRPGVTREDIPRDPYEQLSTAIIAVFESWNSERAKAYRNLHGIPHHKGTAVTVQAMVFGNLDHESCTGVVFSADVATGKEGFYGDFLPRAQGEDVVSGVRTPQPIADMEAWHPHVYRQLVEIVELLAAHYNDIVDVEFTVEKGVLYILQVRRAKRSPLAKATRAVRDQWAKRITREEALERVSHSEVALLRQPQLHVEEADECLARGLAASPGAAVGVVARTSEEAQRLANAGWSPILVRHDTSPDDLSGMMAAKAIVTVNGGKTCHAAVVARELGLPAVVGVSSNLATLPSGTLISVDGTQGNVYRGKLQLVKPTLTKEVNIFLKWHAMADHYVPRIAFERFGEEFSANQFLTDFYMTEVMARLSVGTPYEREANALRTKTHRHIAEIFALYLLIASSGESRHFHSRSQLAEPGRQAIARLDRVVQSSKYGSGDAARHNMHRRVVAALQNRDLGFIITHVDDLVTVFQDWGWGSSFGGAAWAKIAQALHDFLTEKLTATLFVDHVFDLRHNGGRLFNKNPLFNLQTDEHALLKQLDIKKGSHEPKELFLQLSWHAEPSSEVKMLWGVGKDKRMW